MILLPGLVHGRVGASDQLLNRARSVMVEDRLPHGEREPVRLAGRGVELADPLAKPVGDMKFKTDHAVPGASGYQVFRFLVDASGTGTIEMHYIRPWEKSTPPAKVFKLLLIVR